MECRLHSTGVIMATRQDVRSLAPIPNYTTTIAVFRPVARVEKQSVVILRRPPVRGGLVVGFYADGADRSARPQIRHRLFRFGALQAVQSVRTIRAPVKRPP